MVPDPTNAGPLTQESICSAEEIIRGPEILWRYDARPRQPIRAQNTNKPCSAALAANLTSLSHQTCF